MRSYEEINADIAAVRGQLLVNGGGVSRLPPAGHNSPIGREIHSERAELVAKLRDLRAELLATAEDELEEHRRARTVEGVPK